MRFTKASMKTSPAFLLRSYNLFLMKTEYGIKWVDLYIHRNRIDLCKKMIVFGSIESAQNFLNKNPEFEAKFDAWIQEIDVESWDNWQKIHTGEKIHHDNLWTEYECFTP